MEHGPVEDVLKILERDPRRTVEQIAVMTGRNEDEVRAIIAACEQDGTIVRYKTLVNWEKQGLEPVMALIEVRVAPQRGVGFDAIASRIARFPEVRSCYLVSGAYDLALVVTGASMKEISSFVSSRLSTLDSVNGTTTHFLMKRYKEEGELLNVDEDRARLAVSP